MWYNKKNIVLAEVMPKGTNILLIEQRLDELRQLVETYGGLSVVEVVQQRDTPDYKTYLWSWKFQETIALMKEHDAWILVLWNILKPKQIYAINEELRKHDMQARDRVDLILKIFEKHARSTEARLQIELAAIKHMWPRIFGMGMELSRQWWWSKLARGLWETNTEIMRRHLAVKKKKIEKELKKYESIRATNRAARLNHDLPTIGLVWYTNAGKSTLMNNLTNKWVLVEDKLFATLGTDVGQIYYPSTKWKWTTVLVNDTIGFIRDLPPSLIKAFQSTLEDSVEADILFHVTDASDSLVVDKVAVVDEILGQIWATQPRVLVYNKIDNLDDQEAAKKSLMQIAEDQWYDRVVFISATTDQWVESLHELIRNEYNIEEYKVD